MHKHTTVGRDWGTLLHAWVIARTGIETMSRTIRGWMVSPTRPETKLAH